jgi:hypothetical protein
LEEFVLAGDSLLSESSGDFLANESFADPSPLLLQEEKKIIIPENSAAVNFILSVLEYVQLSMIFLPPRHDSASSSQAPAR